MPSSDPIYADMAYEIRERCKREQEQTPRAWALREEVSAFYRCLPLGDPRDALAGLALEVLNVVIERGEKDIDERDEQGTRAALELHRRNA